MAELNEPVETGLPRSVRFGIATVLILIAFAWFLPKKAGNRADNNGAGQAADGAGEKSVSDRESEQQLLNVLKGLSPELIVINTNRLDSVANLVQWAGESLNKGDAATVKVDKEANAKWFTGQALSEVNDPTFSLRDGHHLTMAMLAGDIVTVLAQKTSDPLEQIESLFDFVIRETTLVDDGQDTRQPGTPFESLLTGRATAAGRAWAFATLLRQLQLDAVILEPRGKPEAWLIGAITPAGDVLLYDPRLGTGLPVGPGAEGFRKTATLAQVKEKPELLRLLDVERKDGPAAYPLKGEDLADLNVKLITDSSASSERMAKLQTMVTGGLMEIFDGVGKNSLRAQGLADRVIAAGVKGKSWGKGDVSVWAYPEQQSEAFMSSGAEESPAWRGINAVFLAPKVLTQERLQTKNESDAAMKTVVKRTSDPLRGVRIDHLKGNITKALRNYGRIRDSALSIAMATADPELQQELLAALPLNRKAAELAVYWIAACQLEQNPKNVPNTLQTYLRLYPEGEMLGAIPDLWAASIAATGDKAGAVKFLQGGQPTSRREVLIKQWTESPADSGTTPPATPEKPQDAAPPKVETTPAPAEKPQDAPAPAAEPGPPKTDPAPPAEGGDQPPPPPVAT